jgi:hypothetical protein
MKKHILQENYERFFGKREFGDPLPTFKGVMEKHQVNKLKEDWWDDMSPEDQASYIKDHPGSKQAQQAGGDEEPDYSPGHPDTMDDDELKQFLDKDAEEDEGEPYKREPFQPGDDPEELSLGAAQDELEKAKAELAQAEDESEKKSIQQKIDALQGRIGRTGNELNQETLTINGKQYNRISEGVEKQPKPKHAFSEFYQRFKK